MMSRLTAPGSFHRPESHLDVLLTDPWYRPIWALTNQSYVATTKFWESRSVSAALLPLTTGSISSPMGLGSDSTPVQIQLEGVDTFLADSMQFMLELGCRLDDNGCYYVMPSFRGEAADSTHLCQFYHSEAELPVTLPEIMTVVDEYIASMVRHLLDTSSVAIESVAGTVEHLEKFLLVETPRITFEEALAVLPSTGSEHVRVHAGGARSLTRVAEQLLIAEYGGALWVSHMDHLANPFYQAFADEPGKALNADLLMGIGETAGCGQRHADASSVRQALALHQVDEQDYQWYLRMRELRPLTTSGFGLGLERFLLWVLNHDEIRDLSPLLRFNGQVTAP